VLFSSWFSAAAGGSATKVSKHEAIRPPGGLLDALLN